MDIPSQKQHLRGSIAERLAGINAQERDAESRSLCRRILQNLPKETTVITAFYPMPNEVNIIPLLSTFLERGMQVYLPRMEHNAFTYRLMTSLETLKAGKLRIPEPSEDAPILDDTTLDIALVPGAAFDRNGNRLGRGNGGFDMWLKKLRAVNTHAQVWGICFDHQLVNEVPMAPHDQLMDKVIGPRGIIERATGRPA